MTRRIRALVRAQTEEQSTPVALSRRLAAAIKRETEACERREAEHEEWALIDAAWLARDEER